MGTFLLVILAALLAWLGWMLAQLVLRGGNERKVRRRPRRQTPKE